MQENHPGLSLLKELLAVPSPPGREERTAALVRSKLDGMGWPHETDEAGNVLVRVPGRGKGGRPVVFAAHMDEIGVVVTRIEEGGVLRVAPSGGLYPWKIGECPVEILGDEENVDGVLSMGSIHSRKVRERGEITWDRVYVLTGLTPARLAEAGVRPGTQAVPHAMVRGPLVFGDPASPLVGCWTFDDRIDVVNLLRMLERFKSEGITPPRPLIVAFTVQEENGCHGAKVLAHREEPELFVAVDGVPLLPELDAALDGRPGIWSKDALTHFDQEVVKAFLRASREVGTEMAVGVFDGAASDASAAYAAGAVPRAATVGHIRDNSHGFEVASLASIDNALEVLVRFARTWDG